MKLRTFLILTTFGAAMLLGRSAAAAEQADGYPVLAYAAPADRSFIAARAAAARRLFSADPDLYSGPTSTVKTEEGLLVEWRERVFESLQEQITPLGPEEAQAGGQDAQMRMVARIAMKESVKLVLKRMPRIEQLVRALKLEVSTDMLSSGKDSEGPAAGPVAASAPPHRPAEKERFFMKTGLRVPVESGKLGLLSETNAVYGCMTSFYTIRLDNRLEYSLGLRYALDRDVQLEIERRTVDVSDPSPAGTAGRSVSNLVRLVLVF
jgi:hypothetical protein